MNRPSSVNNRKLDFRLLSREGGRTMFNRPCLRKLGDSNPRYSHPYGSLANYWFQPLTQTSSACLLGLPKSTFSQMRCKGTHFSWNLQIFFRFFWFQRQFSCRCTYLFTTLPSVGHIYQPLACVRSLTQVLNFR